jgi:hypothetical protein
MGSIRQSLSRRPGVLAVVGVCTVALLVVIAVAAWKAEHSVRAYEAMVTGQVLVSADGRTITTATTWTGCETQPRLVAHESARGIAISLHREDHATGNMVCDDGSAQQVTTSLDSPLGSRMLSDAVTGHPIAFFDGRRLVNPRYLPTGYRQAKDLIFGAIGQGIPPAYETPAMPTWTRAYQHVPHRDAMTITQILGKSLAAPGTPATVNGYPASLQEQTSAGQVFFRSISWFDGSTTFFVASYDPLPLNDFLKVANGLSN